MNEFKRINRTYERKIEELTYNFTMFRDIVNKIQNITGTNINSYDDVCIIIEQKKEIGEDISELNILRRKMNTHYKNVYKLSNNN